MHHLIAKTRIGHKSLASKTLRNLKVHFGIEKPNGGRWHQENSNGFTEDSLDAFMNATVAELRQDKGDKLQKRLEDTKETGFRIKERIKGQGTNESRSARSAPPSELDVK